MSAPPKGAAQPQAVTEVSRAATAGVATREVIAQAQADFVEEYRYVITDLKRIGLLAAGMFGLLVVLALIIR